MTFQKKSWADICEEDQNNAWDVCSFNNTKSLKTIMKEEKQKKEEHNKWIQYHHDRVRNIIKEHYNQLQIQKDQKDGWKKVTY